MTWLLHLLNAAIIGLLGLLCGGTLGAVFVKWFRVTSFEGYSGYFMAACGLLGGLIGLIVGLIVSLNWGGKEAVGFLRTLGLGAGSLVGFSLLVLVLAWPFADRSEAPDTETAAQTPAAPELSQSEKDHATLEQMPPDAPLPDWLEALRMVQTPAARAEALERLRAHEGWAAELCALMQHDDPNTAALALHLIAELPERPDALDNGVNAAGEDLVRRLEHAIGTRVEEDASYLWAAEVSQRFSGWIHATRMLYPEGRNAPTSTLERILNLARKRPDSEALRQDVVRVASHYLHEWAGVKPLPTDPPAR